MLRILNIEEVALVSGGLMEDNDSFDDGGAGGYAGGDQDVYIAYDIDGDGNPDVMEHWSGDPLGDGVFIGDSKIDSQFSQQISSIGSSIATELDNVSWYADKGAEASGLFGVYLGISAAAQGGADVPNDALAVGAWATSAALWTGARIAQGFAAGVRDLSDH